MPSTARRWPSCCKSRRPTSRRDSCSRPSSTDCCSKTLPRGSRLVSRGWYHGWTAERALHGRQAGSRRCLRSGNSLPQQRSLTAAATPALPLAHEGAAHPPASAARSGASSLASQTHTSKAVVPIGRETPSGHAASRQRQGWTTRCGKKERAVSARPSLVTRSPTGGVVVASAIAVLVTVVFRYSSYPSHDQWQRSRASPVSQLAAATGGAEAAGHPTTTSLLTHPGTAALLPAAIGEGVKGAGRVEVSPNLEPPPSAFGSVSHFSPISLSQSNRLSLSCSAIAL